MLSCAVSCRSARLCPCVPIPTRCLNPASTLLSSIVLVSMQLLFLFAGLAIIITVPVIIGLYFGGRSLRTLLLDEQQRRGGGSEPPLLAKLVSRTTTRLFLAVPFAVTSMVVYLFCRFAVQKDGVARSTYFTTAMGVLGLALLFTGSTILQVCVCCNIVSPRCPFSLSFSLFLCLTHSRTSCTRT